MPLIFNEFQGTTADARNTIRNRKINMRIGMDRM